MSKLSLIYLIIALFCLCFGAIYSEYSHGVHSNAMTYAFVYPMVGGTLPFLCMSFIRIKKFPSFFVRNLWHCGIATLTVGSIFMGVIEIYGTTSKFSIVYIIVGILLCTSGVAVLIIDKVKSKKHLSQM